MMEMSAATGLPARALRLGLLVWSADDWSVQAVAAAQRLAEENPRVAFTPLRADLSGVDGIGTFDLRFDGLITRLHDPKLVRALERYHLPTVNLSRLPLGLPMVGFDEPEIGRQACRHLADRGAERVIMLRWPDQVPTLDGRQRGAEEICHFLGLPFQVAAVKRPADVDPVLAAALPRTGIFCANDVLGLWALRQAAALGVVVPDRCTVIGVDDSQDICPFARPTLTSVRLDFRALIQAAVTILKGMLSGRPCDVAAAGPAGISVRDSTGLATTDPMTLALAYIQAHCRDNPSLGDVARAAGIHPRALQRLFRTELSSTPLQVIIRERMSLARTMLADNGLGIAEIASACGYASQQRFAATFKQVFGQTPGQFRRRPCPQ